MLRRLSLVTILITFLGFIPSLVFNHGYLLIESDSLNQLVPFVYETKRMLSSVIPFWSWNSFFGDNWISAYSYYTVTNPFAWFCCIFPYRFILVGITIVQFLKYLCVAWLSYAYFRVVKFPRELSALGALLYAFSSWGITNIIYWSFLVPMMVFPVFLIAIEYYLQSGCYRHSCLILATFLVAFTNWYFSPCTLIAGGIYALCRLFGSNLQDKWRLLFRGIADIVAGFCLASFIIVPTITYMLGGPRASVGLGGFVENLYSAATKIVWAVLPKVSENSLGSRATFIPVIGLLFAVLYMIRHRDWLTCLLFITLLIYLTPLNGIFSFFTNISYSRWAYALTMFLTIASLKVIEEGKYRLSDYKLYVGIIVSVIFISFIALAFYSVVNHSHTLIINQLHRNIVILLLFALNVLFLFFFIKSRNLAVLLGGIIICAGLQFAACTGDLEIQLSYDDKEYNAGWLKQHKWVSNWHKKYIYDNDYPVGGKLFTYRTDFITDFRHLNIAQIKNVPSVESFSSAYGKEIVPLLLASDRMPSEIKVLSFPSSYTRSSFDALMSVKNIVDYKDLSIARSHIDGGKLLKRTWNYDVYRYKYYIPMGFTYDSYVDAADMERYNNDFSVPHDVPRQLLANISVNASDVKVFGKYLKKGKIVDDPTLEGQYRALPLDSLTRERRKQTCDWFAGDTHGFSARVNMRKANMLFFSVPCDPGFTATVDGKETKIYNVNLGLSAIEVGKGRHGIRFEFFPQGLREGAVVSLVCLIGLALVFMVESRKPTIL